MLKVKLSKEMLGNVAKGAGSVILYAVMMGLPYLSKKDVKELIPVNKIVEYDDVIGAIMHSSMLGSDKVRASNIVKHANTNIHRAALQVINSDMLSSDKLKVIERIYGEENSQ